VKARNFLKNQIKQERDMHRVPSRQISDTLARLKNRGLIRAVAATKSGNPCMVWEPVVDQEAGPDHEPDQETAAHQAPYMDFFP